MEPTKGVWKAVEDEIRAGKVTIGITRNLSAELGTDDCGFEMDCANAAMMAAAKDMYAAIVALLDVAPPGKEVNAAKKAMRKAVPPEL